MASRRVKKTTTKKGQGNSGYKGYVEHSKFDAERLVSKEVGSREIQGDKGAPVGTICTMKLGYQADGHEEAQKARIQFPAMWSYMYRSGMSKGGYFESTLGFNLGDPEQDSQAVDAVTNLTEKIHKRMAQLCAISDKKMKFSGRIASAKKFKIDTEEQPEYLISPLLYRKKDESGEIIDDPEKNPPKLFLDLFHYKNKETGKESHAELVFVKLNEKGERVPEKFPERLLEKFDVKILPTVDIYAVKHNASRETGRVNMSIMSGIVIAYRERKSMSNIDVTNNDELQEILNSQSEQLVSMAQELATLKAQMNTEQEQPEEPEEKSARSELEEYCSDDDLADA
jgi:hypothetical protein